MKIHDYSSLLLILFIDQMIIFALHTCIFFNSLVIMF